MDQNTFRAIMGRFATGVVVVTARTAAGLHGVTVNAFSSVSLDPPLVLVCFDALANSRFVVEEAGRFGVSVLGERHEFLAERFAGRAPAVSPDFAGVPHRLSPGGQPILDGSLAWLDCRLRDSTEVGDHVIVVAEVDSLGVPDGDPAAPLLYWSGRYRQLADP